MLSIVYETLFFYLLTHFFNSSYRSQGSTQPTLVHALDGWCFTRYFLVLSLYRCIAMSEFFMLYSLILFTAVDWVPIFDYCCWLGADIWLLLLTWRWYLITAIDLVLILTIYYYDYFAIDSANSTLYFCNTLYTIFSWFVYKTINMYLSIYLFIYLSPLR